MAWVNTGKHGLYGWSGRPVGQGVALFYNYGYPAYGALEPDVVGQWLFDEASGDIVDEVSGITLAEAGTLTYGVTASGLYAGISPGIYLPGVGDYFQKATSTAALSPGTGDFTIEFWYSNVMDDGFTGWIADTKDTVTGRGWELSISAVAPDTWVTFNIRAEDDTNMNKTWTLSNTLYNDGVKRKVRIKNVRSGDATLYINETVKGTVDISGLSGKTISNHGITIGANQTGAQRSMATFYEFRLSNNSTNNSTPIWLG